MQVNFDKAAEAILAEEGGYRDDPETGPAKYGITRATLAAVHGRTMLAGEVRTLSPEDAAAIYRSQYATSIRFDDLPSGVDLMMLDFAVHSGPAIAARALQRVVETQPDGVIGLKTLGAARDINPVRIIGKLEAVRMEYLRKLDTWHVNAPSWTDRVARIHALSNLLATDPGGPLTVEKLSALNVSAKADPTGVRLIATSTGQTGLFAVTAGVLGFVVELGQMFLPELEKVAEVKVVQYVSVALAMAAIIRNVLLEQARIARGQAGM